MKSILTKFFVALVAMVFTHAVAFAQKEDVRMYNGRLVFPDEAAYQRVYDQLEKQIAETPAPPEGFDIKEGERYDDYPALELFEKSMGISSLRKADLNSEYDQLSRGVEPENITRSWFTDPISAALVNEYKVVQIGNTIYILNSYDECIRIINGDDRLLSQILAGANPKSLGKYVEVDYRGPNDPPTDPCAGFTASFSFSPSFLTSNSGSFTYTGSPAVSFLWNFGDGTTSTLANPGKTYTTSGVYFVSLQVMDSKGCVANAFFLLPVNQGCIAKFKHSKGGTVGSICFDNESSGTTPIVSYLWEFGDGTTSTAVNPCHTYPCDKEYTVTLTITTASGCTRKTDKKITVNSYKCCDPDIDESETVARWDYQSNRRLKTHANTWHPWIGSDRVSAEIFHYKKWAGIWWRSSANIGVTIEGTMYGPGATGCHCENPFDVGCNDSGNKSHAHAKKNLPLNSQKYKTSKYDPWKALFYHNGNLFRTCVVPADCN